MPRRRSTEEQIAFAPRQHEGRRPDIEDHSEARADGAGILPLEEKGRRPERRGVASLEKRTRSSKPSWPI
jgi:hypothetical protein